MDIKFEKRRIGEVTVLDIVGRLTAGQGAEHLKDKVNSLVEQKRTRIVLNLESVPYIDSGGLGQMFGSFTTCTVSAVTSRCNTCCVIPTGCAT